MLIYRISLVDGWSVLGRQLLKRLQNVDVKQERRICWVGSGSSSRRLILIVIHCRLPAINAITAAEK